MPRINYPATTAFTTIGRNEIQNLLADVNYVIEGRIDKDNLAVAIDTSPTPDTYFIIEIPTKRVIDYADESNPVNDTMKFFGAPSTNTALGTNQILFEPLKDMMTANHVYITDSRTVAWNFTRESSPDKTEKKMIKKRLDERRKDTPLNRAKVIAEGMLAGITLGAIDMVSKEYLKEHITRETSLYSKHAIFDKPKNWVAVPAGDTDVDIDNTFDYYNNKIKYTTEFRFDKRVKSDNNDPPLVNIVINDPSVSDEEIDFEVTVVAPGMRDTEYINLEVTITVFFEIVP